MAERSDGGPTRLLSGLLGGRRTGTLLIVCGIVLAGAAWLLVMHTVRQARAAGAQAAAQRVPQVYAVTTVQDIPASTAIRPDAVAIKAFPAAFAPPGVVTGVDEVVGKFATTNIVKDQLVLNSQVSTTRLSPNLSASIPPGKVAYWMPMPELLALTGGIQPGDRLDILLSLKLTVPKTLAGASREEVTSISTQTTLQNVEVFFVGSAMGADLPSGTASGGTAAGTTPQGASPTKVIAFLLDHQEVLLAKFVKDSGGTLDLVLRSRNDQEVVTTEGVTADTLIDRFKFRVPERWSVGR
ncbi:MAG TPA: Flp pilus assembly protein CpaB [Candidatus Thermoplasmatota archaeon]|nr:Flp pilus assembly protein CpaB [Candidatus Thermoplasmatota archaeon]